MLKTYRPMSAIKKNVTFSVNSEIHKDFKVENAINDSDMSIAVENFMLSYIRASRQLREERVSRTNENTVRNEQ